MPGIPGASRQAQAQSDSFAQRWIPRFIARTHDSRSTKRRLLAPWAVYITVLLALAWPQYTWGQGVVRDSVGATSSGRGGANIAHRDNLSLILDNPAGLVHIPGSERLDLGMDILVTDLDYTNPFNDANGEVMPWPLPEFGYIKKSEDGRWAYGLGIFAPAGFGAHYELRHWLYGKREYGSLGALMKILPTAAYKVNDRLSVGATFGLALSHAQLDMPFNLQTGLLAGLPAMLDLKATGVAPTWSLGLQYQLSEKTTLGLSYIAETRFRLKGDAKADISGVGLPLLKASYDAEVDLVWPRSLGLGLMHQVNDRHRLSADVSWVNWSHAYDKIDLKLTDGANPLFNLILGPKVRDTFPLGWHDSVAVRLGYEYFRSPDEVFRLGYIGHPNPIPDATLIPLLTGVLEHAVTIGYGRQLTDWRLDLAYQYSWGRKNHTTFSRIVGGDFNHSSMKAQAHWLFIGFSRSF